MLLVSRLNRSNEECKNRLSNRRRNKPNRKQINSASSKKLKSVLNVSKLSRRVNPSPIRIKQNENPRRLRPRIRMEIEETFEN